MSPVISTWVCEGLEAHGHGRAWQRRVDNINAIRGADAFIVTANTREVVEPTVRPRLDAFLAARGVRLSPTQTVITPLAQGVDLLGPTSRQAKRPNGQPAKRQITPSRASFQAVKAKITALGQQARTPQELIETVHPVLRGWAHSHRQGSGGEMVAQLDAFVWRRTYRGAKHRQANTTGRWIARRDVPHHRGEPWRFTDPRPGTPLLRVPQAIKGPCHLKGKASANPCAPKGDAYFQRRDCQLTRRGSAPFRDKVLRSQPGLCPVCRQVRP
jgi:RNA-directed DNA polymerase